MEKRKLDLSSEPSKIFKKELSRTLKMSHACDKKFCPCLLKIVGSFNFSKENLVYVCDFCQTTVSDEENMRRHLKKYFHYSASEYITEKSLSHDNVQYILPRTFLILIIRLLFFYLL